VCPEISWAQLINRLIYIAVFEQFNYNSWPLPLEPHSSLLFHVKHFLQKKAFLSGKVAEFSVKIPKYYLGQLQNVCEKTGNETRIHKT